MKSTHTKRELREIIETTVKEFLAERERDSEKTKRLKARKKEEEKWAAQRKKASMAGLDSLARGIVEATPVKVSSSQDPNELRALLAQALMEIEKMKNELNHWRDYGAKMKGVKPGMDTEQCLNFVNQVEKATKGNLHGKK